MQSQIRADRNHGTSGVVDALAQQVLTKTALLAFEHVGQGAQRPFVGSGNRTAASAVVKKNVHRFLQHSLFIANDDFGSVEFLQSLQTIIPVNDAAI
ncbi:MAG: hypothetical protein BWX55_00386 [Deltaproteobacteria bacterium ADurb.Bin022]|nr:MAG: hypothetical protein BWX55_00386 [Deltaproteobacteria bacterium ADurb.Bin022]